MSLRHYFDWLDFVFMARASWVEIVMVLVVIVIGFGCSAGHGDDGERELTSDCSTYVLRLEQCMSGINPEMAFQRTAATRQALTIAAKGHAARERLAAECRAGVEQLSRACR